ncbi:MAG TPA: decarboxylating 6-phosphogluconate dehydrogenase [Anaerolineales bacterium]|nr:decarboxylating 6-phosphogluconate dehydrogenase [Anaerolineales bacterium]
MQVAILGLGRMGGNMARRLRQAGHEVVGWNRSTDITQQISKEVGLVVAKQVEDVVKLLETPRAVWLMLPAGDVTENILGELIGLLSKGDIVVEGGNSNFRDTMRRAEMLGAKGIHMLDAGVSGGIWGLKEGYSLMLGGDEEIVERLRPIFESLAPAPAKGWGRVGPSGAGHFVKMVHNGIEYGMMQSFAEGFEIMQAREDFALDLHRVAKIWQHGSVVRSWLLDLAERALKDDPKLSQIADYVEDSGEGRWTVFEAINENVPAPVITLALLQRLASRQESSFAAKMLAALRNQFGGHALKKPGS